VYKTRISLLILLVIGLHALPVLSYQGEHQTRWPFLAWAMYARSYPPGPVVVVMARVIATSASGKEKGVTATDVGVPGPAYNKMYLGPLAKGDTTSALELIHRLNRRRDDPVVQVRLEGDRVILADSGVVNEPLPVVTYRAGPSATRGDTSP
jgi:hypothetical protein